MPTIEITREQEQALNRGETIQIVPGPLKIEENLLIRYNGTGHLYWLYKGTWNRRQTQLNFETSVHLAGQFGDPFYEVKIDDGGSLMADSFEILYRLGA